MRVPDKEWYKDWFNSPYYHLLYKERNEQEAAAFIDLLLKHLKPKQGSFMLDIACGKGRHSIHLAQKGYQVTGIDISPESIREAQQNANDSIEFFIHDMRMPFRVNYYDCAFNFFTSFGYFDTEREHLNAMHNMALAIRKNGILVIDYLNPAFIIANLDPFSELMRSNIEFNVERTYDKNYFYKKILIRDPQKPSPLIFTEKVARFSLYDFEDMFQKNGLKLREVFGDYDLNEYQSASSPRMIMIAQKQETLA